MTATKTYHYSGDISMTVTVSKIAGRIQVIASNSNSYPVGMLSPEKQLKACGWRIAKKVVQYDVWGRRIR